MMQCLREKSQAVFQMHRGPYLYLIERRNLAGSGKSVEILMTMSVIFLFLHVHVKLTQHV